MESRTRTVSTRGEHLTHDALRAHGIRLVGTGVAALVLASSATASDWQTVCAEPVEMPEIVERVGLLLPQPGVWRGKGFGDKRKLDAVDIEECGLEIVGMAGVRLRGNVPKMVPLELDEDDGRYKASFEYSEGGMAAVVTWDVEVESPSRVTGRMTIMGRGDEIEFELLEAKPSAALAACECQAVENRRDALADQLEEVRQDPLAGEIFPWGWTVDPKTCAVGPPVPDRSLPTQNSFEVLLRADWAGELVHRERCCSVYGSGDSTYEEWVTGSVDDHAGDKITALTAQLDILDTWIEDRCEEP